MRPTHTHYHDDGTKTVGCDCQEQVEQPQKSEPDPRIRLLEFQVARLGSIIDRLCDSNEMLVKIINDRLGKDS